MEGVTVKLEDMDDDSVVMMEPCGEEWGTMLSEDDHCAASQIRNNHLLEVTNTVFNLFKQVIDPA